MPTQAALEEGHYRKDSTSTRYPVLGAVSFSHMLNDMMQSLIVAIYPLLKADFALDFVQIGLITLTFQMMASVLQPVVGHVTDRCFLPYSLPFGMAFTCSGLLLMAMAPSFALLLLAVGLIGTGSSIFHPESSRVTRMAAGGRPGFAQSIFMVGGHLGTAIGPLLAAWIVIPSGRGNVAWFAMAALLAFMVLLQVGRWYATNRSGRGRSHLKTPSWPLPSPGRVRLALLILLVLVFSKFFYLASIKSYYTFYLIETFGMSVGTSEIFLFLFMLSSAIGVIVGGPLGDRFGRKWVICFSIFGVTPFTLLLPHANLYWTVILSVPIGVIIASALPAVIVYAQELVPSRLGMISGLFYGLAFGMGGIGAAVLGHVADLRGVDFVYRLCAFLPLPGVFALYLPGLHSRAA